MGNWNNGNGGQGQCICANHLNDQYTPVSTIFYTDVNGYTTSTSTSSVPIPEAATTFGPVIEPEIIETILQPLMGITTSANGNIGLATTSTSTVVTTIQPAQTLMPALPPEIEPANDDIDTNDYLQGYCNLPCGGNTYEWCGGQNNYFLVWERQ